MAYADPEKAIDLVVEYARRSRLPSNRVHQRWMLDRYRDLYNPQGAISTNLSEKDYLFAANILKENGSIPAIPPFESFFVPALKNGFKKRP
jgi:NitT/TauT family transport system substrate-binding protein